MKKILIFFTIPYFIFMAACCDTNETQADNGNIIVETSIGNITEAEFVETLKELHGEAVLSEMVQMKILIHKSEEMGITEEDIQREIDELKTSWNVISDEEFYEILEFQGIQGERDLHERIVSHLVLQNLVGHVGEFSNEELEAEYELGEEVEAKHILVSERELAEELLERVQAGEDFSELAEVHSQDPGSRNEGGHLGFFQRGTMTPPFEEAAFQTEVGSVSDLIPTTYGYHIIQVTDKHYFEESFEEVKETLRSALNNRKIYQMGQKQEELFAEVDVNLLDPQFKLSKFTN